MAAAGRLLRALVHGIAGWLTIVFLFPRLAQPQRDARVQVWALQLLKILGVSLQVHGHPPASGPMLLVANHISWLDILVMHGARHCRFVSKSEVRHWPLIGRLATGAGTLYIEREKRRDALRVVHRIAESLRAGDVVAVFPEGTTSDGLGVLPFHANLLQAAIAADAPVQPVGLNFVDRGSQQPALSAAYLDDDSLVGSVWRLLNGPPVTAVLNFGVPQRAGERDRRTWATDLREAVVALREGEAP
jgi:1-acyl-sn-glycerol-3-phosphate acyltransferase